MDDLIEALTILRKYGNPHHPTCCSHDTLHVCGISPDRVSPADIERLDKLGFFVSVEDEDGDTQFVSYRFGSC